VITGRQQSVTASVANTTDSTVTWSVNNIPGGNSTVGTISSDGSYTAPSNVPTPATVTITATSSADSTVSATASVTISAPPKSGGGAIDWFTLGLLAFGCCGGMKKARPALSSAGPLT
jgi:hypothetical protein